MGGDLIVLFVLLLGIGFLLVFIFTIWILSRLLHGTWLWIAIAIVCVTCYALYEWKVGRPSAHLKEVGNYRSQVLDNCYLALKDGPKEVVASSLTDEVGALTDEQLIQLLTERGLEFVELRVYSILGVATNWTSFFDSIPTDSPSKLSAARPFARISIAVDSDPYCVRRQNGAERLAPVLPGHCLRVEPVSELRGSHRIQHEPAKLSESPRLS